MKLISFALLVAVVAMASADSSRLLDVSKADELFEKFIVEHKREYKDAEDREVHFRAFKANLEKINKLNEQNPTATFGINKFADYTEEESKGMRGLRTNKQ